MSDNISITVQDKGIVSGTLKCLFKVAQEWDGQTHRRSAKTVS